MYGNFLTVTLFSYFKEMTSGCKTFLPVYKSMKCQSLHSLSYACIVSIRNIKSIRRSTQESSIRIDRFVFWSTSDSNKLDEKVKILGK